MRILLIFFSLYQLALTTYPCSDASSCADEVKSGTVAIDTSNHDHHPVETDQCSPFCICSCCAVTIQVTFPQLFQFPKDHPQSLVIPFHERLIPTNTQAIWQPPKAG